ncbi:unnamed protein product [Litomosoides sigmodontis]|uniref:Uncharacterized protein n=1 Tax=Litomosoides sigmodontis TaxID=42156 RepID=A0A3P7K2V5_LITSI|nr:unnamed protein product [Litomosoides sigmodontis]
MVASKEQPLLVRPLAKKRSAMSSRARTEDPNRSDSSDNECLEEKSILLEKVGPREEHNGGMEAEKYNSDSDS